MVVSKLPIVVERSMYWDVDTPSVIMRAGGTCSMAIPQVTSSKLTKEETDKSLTGVSDWHIY